MASIIDLLPTELLFLVVFAVLPVFLTLRERGRENVSGKEWASYALILVGGILVYTVSSLVSSIRMQLLLWPLLVVLGLGFLLYREVLVERGEWDEESIRRGGASYDD